eukprot:RCo039793
MIRPVGGSRRGRGLAQWFRELPPTTRAYVVCCTAMTLLCGLELVSPYSVVLVRPALTQLQLWRLLTNLLWLGPLNLGTLLHFVLLITYSSKMEVWMASTAPVPDRAASQFPYFMAVSMALLNVGAESTSRSSRFSSGTCSALGWELGCCFRSPL